ncbi:MAG: archease [Gemmatimonadales bacterium]
METPLTGAAAPPSHEFVEHTGEVRLHVRASSLACLLEEAGCALGSLMLRGHIGTTAPEWTGIEVESADRTALLVDWLNELVYLAETSHTVPTEFRIIVADQTRVSAQVRGVPVEQPPSLVKAATLHQARVVPTEGGYEADVILDV